jgi:hypothetical protein
MSSLGSSEICPHRCRVTDLKAQSLRLGNGDQESWTLAVISFGLRIMHSRLSWQGSSALAQEECQCESP